MGLNAYVAFHLVQAQKLTALEAMGVIVVEGLVIALFVVTGFREAVLNAIPMTLKRAIGAGIGLFLALIGFGQGGITLPGFEKGPLLQLGHLGTARTGVFVFGLLLALVLIARKVRGTLLLAILASVVTGARFLAAMLIAPLAAVVPGEGTAAALVAVGFLMAGGLREIDWKDPAEAAPAFLCSVGMPFTYSISDGIGLGVIAHVILKRLTGKAREVHLMMWLTAAAFVAFLALSQR